MLKAGESRDLGVLVRNVPDFPKPGVQFKDITTLLKNAQAFRRIIDGWVERYKDEQIDAIVGVDARGFIFAGALAYAMGLPFIPVRKKGKLPAETYSEEFQLEYGTDCVEIHRDALDAGARVVVVDDLLATGGTVRAICRLLERLGAEVAECVFVIELPPLKGREALNGYAVHSLIQFMVE